jgi:histidinol phosphatase-like enzyme (inositol monophosphatase family)
MMDSVVSNEALPSLEFFLTLVEAAGKITLPKFRTRLTADAKVKAGVKFDPVTEADRDAEIAIRGIIGATYPHHSILGEEFGLTGSGAIQWVIDPIDGTKPYLCGIPVWGTLIGLTVDGRAVRGIMSQPHTGEFFWGDQSEAFCDGARGRSKLRTSDVRSLADAICHTTSPEPFARRSDRGFAKLSSAVKFTRYGGECYAFAMLAAGQIDLCVEPSLQPYDIVPLIPIIESAGGVVTRFDGGRAERGGKILASANRSLHEAALEMLNFDG